MNEGRAGAIRLANKWDDAVSECPPPIAGEVQMVFEEHAAYHTHRVNTEGKP